MEIGLNITYFREKKKMSQNKLARIAGISQSGINDIESGKRNPRLETLELIAKGLEISVSDLVSDMVVYPDPAHAVELAVALHESALDVFQSRSLNFSAKTFIESLNETVMNYSKIRSISLRKDNPVKNPEDMWGLSFSLENIDMNKENTKKFLDIFLSHLEKATLGESRLKPEETQEATSDE